MYPIGVLSYAILFACTGLLVYWVKRCLLILSASSDEVDRVLNADIQLGRAVLALIRCALFPSTAAD
jgi:hypothetical protein